MEEGSMNIEELAYRVCENLSNLRNVVADDQHEFIDVLRDEIARLGDEHDHPSEIHEELNDAAADVAAEDPTLARLILLAGEL